MIQSFADWLVYDVFGLNAGTALGSSVNFFFYDTIKILLLLLLISIIMGIINAYFPIERLREYLVSRKLYGLQYFFAFAVWCNNAILFLFVNTIVYRLRKGRNTIGSYFCISYNLTIGK